MTALDGEKKGAWSFYHWAALGSLLALPVAVVIRVLAGTSASLESRLMAEKLALGFGGVLLLAGLAAGVVALCGIPRYGRRHILWMAVVGILLTLGGGARATAWFLGDMAKAREVLKNPGTVEEQLNAIAERLNRHKGEMIDGNTRLAGVEVLPGRTLVYHYTVLKVSREEFAIGLLKIEANMKEAYKEEPEMRGYRENGVTVVSRYANEAGEDWGEVKVGGD